MKKIIVFLSVLIFCSQLMLIAQPRYQISVAEFSTKKYDEFCPVIYNDQVVFCSNQENELLISYRNNKNMSLFNIFKVDKNADASNEGAEVFSKNLITPFNDGPVSFNQEGNLIVFSRNIDSDAKVKNIFDINNNLGLFFAELIEGDWTNIVDFKYNDIKYSITTPCFSPDGKTLYYGSDMPGGFGGTDLYSSKLVNGEWSEPENLGSVINTKGNEVYPFLAENGDLFFASDGHGGMGKKDLFLSRKKDFQWITPVPLDAPINSKEDDFGLITDKDFSEGYFSTNRDRSDDIFKFSTLVPQLFDCDTLLENQYCFEFWDELYPGLDSLPVVYEWIFSDGTKKRGIKVEHCLPGAGNHWAKLNIIDNVTSNTFFTQSSMEFELNDHIQPYITSQEAGISNTEIKFDGLKSNLPGFSIEEYIWEFDNGNYYTGVETIHKFKKIGEYGIKLGITGYPEGSDTRETRCVIKPFLVVRDNQALAIHLSQNESQVINEPTESVEENGGEINQDFSVFEVDPEKEVFRVEVLSSNDKIMLDDSIFDPLREKFEIKEFYFSKDSLYSYTIGEYNSLLKTYNIYNDAVSKGFSSAKVKTYVLAELPTEIIAKINRDFAEFADANFEFNQFEVADNSYPVLDKIVEVMKDNPDLNLEIAAHTDNVGSFEYNMELSQKRAQSIVNYLTSKGIDKVRLAGNGYGESRPIASNSTEEGQMKNRRVEFIILNK